MRSVYFFLSPTYDFQQATLVEGALSAGFQVLGSSESNYCRKVKPVSDWSELKEFDIVFYGERTLDAVQRLKGTPGHPALVFVDGGDTKEISLPPSAIPSYLFKRELTTRVVSQCRKIKGLGFGIEKRYVQEFTVFSRREYLMSCMLRLDTNPFRRVLKESVDQLSATYGARIFNGSTGEISYTGQSPVPQATPKYSKILASSCISVSCHGFGEDTGRFWEILGAGCLLFAQRMTIAIPDLPVDGKHCVYFDNEQDFLAKSEYYLTHLDEAEQIARAGQTYALARASTKARFEYVLHSLKNADQVPHLRDRYLIWSHNLKLRYQRRLSRLMNNFGR